MTKTIITAILFLIIFCSCRAPRYVYSASVPNIPYFKGKGDSKLATYYSSNYGDNTDRRENKEVDIQTAYAISDHWALTSSFLSKREADEYDGTYYNNIFSKSSVKYKRNFTDIGTGYFTALEKANKVTFNLYSGLGFGKFHIYDNGVDDSGITYNRYYQSNIFKWYLQSGVNFMPSKYLSFSFIQLFSWAYFFNVKTSYTQAEQSYFYLDRVLHSGYFIYEPSTNIEVGFPKCNWIKLEGDLSFALLLQGDPNSRTVISSIGLVFDPLKLKKHK